MEIFIKEDRQIKGIEVEIRCRTRDEEVENLIEKINTEMPKIVGNKDGEIYVVDAKKVFYVETVDNRLFIYLREEVLEGKYKLYQIEELLKEKCFLRCSKSTIINIAKIEIIKPLGGRSLLAVMENGEEIYISRNYAKKLKEVLGG